MKTSAFTETFRKNKSIASNFYLDTLLHTEINSRRNGNFAFPQSTIVFREKRTGTDLSNIRFYSYSSSANLYGEIRVQAFSMLDTNQKTKIT
jgi:hypothetical protein